MGKGLVGSVIGGVAGFMVGGPAGAMVGAGIGGQVGGAADVRKAQKEQADIMRQQTVQMERAAELERRKTDIANARMLRASIRSARIARGQVVNIGAQTGTSESSGVLGGLASLDTQAGVNRGVFVQGQDIAERQYQVSTTMGRLHSASGSAAARAASGQFYGSVGEALFGMGGGYKTLFGV